MNKVIIVGHLCSAYEEVEELLRMCGMVHANQSIREGFTPQQITATLCKAHGITKYYENISQIDIGAVWHGMVLDLMLANIEQSFWGWSDPNVIYLLNFWKSIDPKIAFILVYDKPESVFTRHEITASSEQNHTKEMLNAWSAYNLELLDFYRKNSDRCLLVHAQQVRLSAASYIQQLKIRINKNFKFPNKLLWKGTEISCLEESPKRGTKSKKIAKQSEEIAQYQQTVETTAILSCNPNDNALSRYIAKALAHNDRQSAKVYKELQESANLPLINEGVEGVAAADAWQAMMDQIYKSQTQTKQIQNLTEQLSRAEQNAQNTVHSLELEINKAKAEYEEVKNRAEALKHEQSKQLEKLNEQSKKTEDIEKQKAALSQNLQQTEKLAKERAEQLEQFRKQLEEAKKQAETLKQEQSKQLEKLNEQSKKTEDIEKQKAALSQNLQQTEKLAKERAEQLEQLKKQLEETKRQTLEKEKQAKELEAKNKELQAKEQNALANGELEQENELLLSQLHQVQEELEKYYLENQELKKNSKLADAPAKPKLYGAKERVKNTLQYRIGNTMIEHWRSGKLTLLSAVKKVQKEYESRPKTQLPPLEDYADAEEGYKAQKHLSYRLGVTWLNHKNILTLPKAILQDVREFREYRG